MSASTGLGASGQTQRVQAPEAKGRELRSRSDGEWLTGAREASRVRPGRVSGKEQPGTDPPLPQL